MSVIQLSVYAHVCVSLKTVNKMKEKEHSRNSNANIANYFFIVLQVLKWPNVNVNQYSMEAYVWTSNPTILCSQCKELGISKQFFLHWLYKDQECPAQT